MKKTNLLYFISIGLLLFLPFIRVSVAVPPSWVKIEVGDMYTFSYTINIANRDGAFGTEGVDTLIGANLGSIADVGFVYTTEGMGQYNISHTITAVGDLGPDLEY